MSSARIRALPATAPRDRRPRPVNLSRNPFEVQSVLQLVPDRWRLDHRPHWRGPAFSVIYMLVMKGGARRPRAFHPLPPAGFEEGGGIGNAIQGTLVTVGIAALVSIPVSLFAAIYLAELKPEGHMAKLARFLSKVLTGFPSILAGVFVYRRLCWRWAAIQLWREALPWRC